MLSDPLARAFNPESAPPPGQCHPTQPPEVDGKSAPAPAPALGLNALNISNRQKSYDFAAERAPL